MDVRFKEVADLLFEARLTNKALDRVVQTDLDVESALDLQLDILRRLEARGQTLGGWKASFSSGRSRDRMGPAFRPYGYILSERIFDSGARIEHSRIANCKIEPELCVVFAEPLHGSDVSVEQAKKAVLGVAPAFEINELRLGPNKNDNMLAADGMGNWGIVVGPVVPVTQWLPDTRMRLFKHDVLVADVTPGEGMDDPFLALARCSQVMSRHGIGFKPGQKVITGSFSHADVDGPATYRAEFSGIGSVSVNFI